MLMSGELPDSIQAVMMMMMMTMVKSAGWRLRAGVCERMKQAELMSAGGVFVREPSSESM